MCYVDWVVVCEIGRQTVIVFGSHANQPYLLAKCYVQLLLFDTLNKLPTFHN